MTLRRRQNTTRNQTHGTESCGMHSPQKTQTQQYARTSQRRFYYKFFYLRHPATFSSQGPSLMTTLFESWTQCEGNWTKSSLYLEVCSKDKITRRGVKRWMIFKEMCDKFGEEGATFIAEHKKSDKKLSEQEIRPHPNAPNCKERRIDSVFV